MDILTTSVVWCGAVRHGVAWGGVAWCCVAWLGAVWCGVVCRRCCYQMAMAGMVLHVGNASREGCVSKCVLCVCSVLCWNSVHCLTTCGQWAVELLVRTAALPWGSGQWNFSCTLSHYPWAVSSGTLSVHCLTASGQWAVELPPLMVELLLCTTRCGVVWCGVVFAPSLTLLFVYCLCIALCGCTTLTPNPTCCRAWQHTKGPATTQNPPLLHE